LQYAGFNSVVGFQVTSPYMKRSSSSLNDQLETSKLEIKQKNRITPSTSCSKIENPIIFDSPRSKPSRTLTEDLLLNSEHIRARFFNMTPESSISMTPSKLRLYHQGVSVHIIDSSNTHLIYCQENVDESNHIKILKNISILFSALTLLQYIPISISLPLLSKLAGRIENRPEVSVVVQIGECSKFLSYFRNSNHVRIFVVESLKRLFPIVRALGPKVSMAFSNCLHLFRIAPSVQEELRNAAFEDQDNGSAAFRHVYSGLSGSFLRPFKEEMDDRNDYKSQVHWAHDYL